jgi:hypothetical protein
MYICTLQTAHWYIFDIVGYYQIIVAVDENTKILDGILNAMYVSNIIY